AGDQLDRHAAEPSGVIEQHGQGQRLFAGRARYAPYLQRPTACRQFRHDVAHDRAQLIDLAPEVRLMNGQRVHHLRPLVMILRIFQKVVIVHERAEAPCHDQRSQTVSHLIELGRIVVKAQSLMNQVAKDLGDTARYPERIDAILHSAHYDQEDESCARSSLRDAANIAARRTSTSGSVRASVINFLCGSRVPRLLSARIAASRTAMCESSSADSIARDAPACCMRPSASTLAQRTSGEGSARPRATSSIRRLGNSLNAVMAASRRSGSAVSATSASAASVPSESERRAIFASPWIALVTT